MWSLESIINKRNWKQKDFISWAAENNFKYVELVSYYMNKENKPKEIKSLLEKLGLEVSCYTISPDFTDSSEYAESELIKDFNNASILKAPFIRVLTGDSASPSAGERARIIQKLRGAVKIAEEKDITLILENIGSYSGSADEAAAIIEGVNSERLRINLDTANPLLADESPFEAAKKLLPFVAYVHLKDFITEGSDKFKDYSSIKWRIQTSRKSVRMTGIEAGSGEAQLPEIMTALKKNGYKGFVSIEYENDLAAEKAVIDSLSFIRLF
jgi:sugar phosphate isomerase/epimerase